MVGDTDHLRVMLDHEDGVALVAQALEERVDLRNVVGMQADRRLVEHVGHVRQRRADVAHHLGPLRLAAGKRPGRSVEAEVAQTDVHERVQAVLKIGQQRRHGRLVERAYPLGQIADLQRARVGDADARDLRGACRGAEPRAGTLGARGEGDDALDKGAHVRLERFEVPGQRRLLELADDAFEGNVDSLGLDPYRLVEQQVVQLPLRELAHGLVHVEEARSAEDAPIPAVHAVTGDEQRSIIERPARVEHLGQVEVRDATQAVAARAHAAGHGEGAPDRLAGATLDLDRARAVHGWHVERERLRPADVRLSQSAEEQSQEGVGVGHGAHGRARVGAHALLVDDDRSGQVVERIHVRSRRRADE